MRKLVAVQEALGGPATPWGARIGFWGFQAPERPLASQDVPTGPNAETLAQRLTIAVALSGMKDFQVAAAANVTSKWLGSVKSGRTKAPPADKLRAVAQVTGVTLRWLAWPLGWYDDEPEGDVVAAASCDPRLAGDPDKQRALMLILRAILGEAESQETTATSLDPLLDRKWVARVERDEQEQYAAKGDARGDPAQSRRRRAAS